MKISALKKLNIPDKPGVYFFLSRRKTLYIGKATNLKSRVRSYFSKDLIKTRGASIVDMVFKSDSLKFEETDSALEALLLEAELIRKYNPYYNVKEKDGKSPLVVGITKEEFPQVISIRKKDLSKNKKSAKILRGKREVKLQAVYGPFTNGSLIREGLRIVRRIFPFRDDSSAKKDNYEFYRQLGLTPYIKSDSKATKEYAKNIRSIKLLFQGKKKKVVEDLRKDMMRYAKHKEFEQADKVKKTIFALEHINDVALLKNDFLMNEKSILDKSRIEGYDVAHMGGKNTVGVMTVVSAGEVDKNEYKKFIIRSQSGPNDTGSLEELLSRRLRHTEWGLPDLVVVDGALAQINVAKQVLARYQLDIPIVSVVKDDRHKAKEILGDKKYAAERKKEILLVNSEAHRFAIAFHKQKRRKSFI